MAKQRMVNTKFWDDTYIIKLDPIEKLLFLYFLTNQLTNISGIYEISLRRIAFDTGIDSEMVEKILKRFEKEKKLVYRNGWIYIFNFIKNQNLNPSVSSGIEREISLIPKKNRDILAQAVTGWVQEGTLNLTKLNLTKLNALAIASSKKRPFYEGLEMRKKSGKWFVLPAGGGSWLEFVGEEKDIKWQ